MTESQTPPPPPLRRRNSIATSAVIPTMLTVPSIPLHTSSLPPPLTKCGAEFELASLKSPSLTYTSLKDILPPSAVNSPTAGAVGAAPSWGSAYDISIRNRLVKHAAWAYLQPMSASPDSSGHHYFRRFWHRFCSRNPIASCLRFINLHVIPSIAAAFDRILRMIGIR